jgi:hypothetical protein
MGEGESPDKKFVADLKAAGIWESLLSCQVPVVDCCEDKS